jgi:hypothetical protein
VYPAIEAWRLALPGAVLAVAARDRSEPVHSHIKFLGDRSILLKYLNPNTLFVACGTPDDVRSSQVRAPQASSLKSKF